MSAASQQLVIVIDERLAKARQEIAALEAARAHMSSAVTAAADPAASRSAAVTSPSRGARRRPRSTPALPAAAGPRAARTSAPAADAPRTAPRRRSARRGSTVSAVQLEQLLTDGAILTTPVVAELAGGTPDQVRALLRELESAGRVRRLGAGRGTRWRAITDEDRIAERAAQLARQSRQAQAGQA